MTSILTKPYLISWLAAPLLVLLSVVFQHAVEIQFYATYYVLSNLHIVLAGAILLFMAGTGYWLLHLNGKKVTGKLTRLHLLFTIGALLFFALPTVEVGRMNAQQVQLLLGGMTVLFAGQVIYLVNLFIVLFRPKNRPTV